MRCSSKNLRQIAETIPAQRAHSTMGGKQQIIQMVEDYLAQQATEHEILLPDTGGVFCLPQNTHSQHKPIGRAPVTSGPHSLGVVSPQKVSAMVVLLHSASALLLLGFVGLLVVYISIAVGYVSTILTAFG